MFYGRPASLKLGTLNKALLSLIGAFDDHGLCCGLGAVEMAAAAWVSHHNTGNTESKYTSK